MKIAIPKSSNLLLPKICLKFLISRQFVLIMILTLLAQKCRSNDDLSNIQGKVGKYCSNSGGALPATKAFMITNSLHYRGYHILRENGNEIKIYFRNSQPAFIAEISVKNHNALKPISNFIGKSVEYLNSTFSSLETESDGSFTLPTMDAESLRFIHSKSAVIEVKIICALSGD